jgi:5-methylcytosine-specific restriction endonuclease McrA
MKSFEELVSALRPVVTPKPFYGRKCEATPEQWAADMEYRSACQKRWRAKDPQRAAAVSKRASLKHYAKNADAIRATAKEQATRYYRENREAVLAKMREKYAAKPERFRQYVANRRKTTEFRTKQRQRYATNLSFRIKKVARARLRSVISGRSGWRLVGADIDHVVRHLGAMFTPGMSWDNYGVSWQIDHIFPLAAANLTDELELAAVCNWRNLQPLTTKANLSKKDKVTDKARRLLETIKQEIRSAREKTIVATA